MSFVVVLNVELAARFQTELPNLSVIFATKRKILIKR
jgi:hypothetical protein